MSCLFSGLCSVLFALLIVVPLCEASEKSLIIIIDPKSYEIINDWVGELKKSFDTWECIWYRTLTQPHWIFSFGFCTIQELFN